MCSHVICCKIQPFSFLPSRHTARSTAPKKQSCQGAQSCLKKYKHSRHFHQALEAAQIKRRTPLNFKKSIHVSSSIPVRERSRGPEAWPRYESWNLKSDMLAPVWERSALASGCVGFKLSQPLIRYCKTSHSSVTFALAPFLWCNDGD